MKSMVLMSLLLFAMAVASLASAKAKPEYTQFGHDVRIAADQQTGDITCFGCSVYVRGEVAGDVTTMGGSVILQGDGAISGDVTALGGSVRADSSTKIGGDLTAFGGRVDRQPGSAVGGDVTTFGGPGWMLLIFGLPLAMFAGLVALIYWLVQRPRNRVQLARAA